MGCQAVIHAVIQGRERPKGCKNEVNEDIPTLGLRIWVEVLLEPTKKLQKMSDIASMCFFGIDLFGFLEPMKQLSVKVRWYFLIPIFGWRARIKRAPRKKSDIPTFGGWLSTLSIGLNHSLSCILHRLPGSFTQERSRTVFPHKTRRRWKYHKCAKQFCQNCPEISIGEELQEQTCIISDKSSCDIISDKSAGEGMKEDSTNDSSPTAQVGIELETSQRFEQFSILFWSRKDPLFAKNYFFKKQNFWEWIKFWDQIFAVWCFLLKTIFVLLTATLLQYFRMKLSFAKKIKKCLLWEIFCCQEPWSLGTVSSKEDQVQRRAKPNLHIEQKQQI